MFHHETHWNVASSSSPRVRNGLLRQTSSVLYAPLTLSAMALSYESPTVPLAGRVATALAVSGTLLPLLLLVAFLRRGPWNPMRHGARWPKHW